MGYLVELVYFVGLADLVGSVDLIYLVLMVEMYQSIVLLKPSSRLLLDLNPNSFSALDTSNIRRGRPSGFVASQTISP